MNIPKRIPGEVLMPISFGLISAGAYMLMFGLTNDDYLALFAGSFGVGLGLSMISKSRGYYLDKEHMVYR